MICIIILQFYFSYIFTIIPSVHPIIVDTSLSLVEVYQNNELLQHMYTECSCFFPLVTMWKSKNYNYLHHS